MNKSILVVMFGGLVAAIVVAMLVQSNLSSGSGDGDKPSIPTTEILVAAKKLVIGGEVNEKNVRWQEWPKSAVFKGIIIREEQEDEKNIEVYGKVLRRTLDAGEPITMKTVVGDGSGSSNFLAASLRPNMRAVSVEVTAATSVGGFVRPGDFVDVVLTYQVRLRGSQQDQTRGMVQRFASQTILSNVRVLAVDQIAKEGDREAKVGRTVTLEVDKAGGEKLALSTSMGDLSLALRKLGEEDDPDVKTKLTTDVIVSDVLQKANQIENQVSVSTNSVRVYSADEVKNIPVRSVK